MQTGYAYLGVHWHLIDYCPVFIFGIVVYDVAKDRQLETDGRLNLIKRLHLAQLVPVNVI
jgi:hypothetical protein